MRCINWRCSANLRQLNYGVGVAVGVRVGVAVGVGPLVGVLTGVIVAPGVGVRVGVAVYVGELTLVGMLVGGVPLGDGNASAEADAVGVSDAAAALFLQKYIPRVVSKTFSKVAPVEPARAS